MISQAGWWTQTPSATSLQPKKWNAHFCITFNFWWLVGLVDGLKPHPPLLSSQKKWNAHFWIMFNFWWSAWLIDELEPHLPPLSYQKNEMLIFVLHSTFDDWLGLSMDLNPIHHLSPPKKMKCSYFDYVQLLMIGQVGQWTRTPSTTCLQPKKMKCSFLDYAQLLMISQAVRWNQTPSATPLQTIKWNAHFWITFNFWWSAGLVDGLEPHPPPVSSQKWNVHILIMFNFWWLAGLVNGLKPHPSPLSSQKNEMLIFVLRSTSDVGHPIHHPSPANKMKCFFLDNVHFWWSAILVDGLKPRLPPLSSQRDEMLIFVLCLTSNDQLGWSMDSNPICHPFPAKTVKCSFLYYIQHLMLARLVNGLEPHPPPLSSQ